ncbi:hypothetical protein D3C79_484490 [compost metagenome]
MAEVDQADDHGAGLVIQVPRLHREEIRPQVDADRIQPGGAGAECDQRIHGGAAVAQRAPGVAVKMPAGEHHHRQRDQTHPQPRALGFRCQRHTAAKQTPGHQRNAQRQAERRLPAEALHVGLRGLLLALAAFGFVLDHFRAVAGFFHCRHQRLRIGTAGNQRAAFRQIDPRQFDAGHALQRALDFTDAAGATHAAEQQLNAVIIVAVASCRKGRGGRCLGFRQFRG